MYKRDATIDKLCGGVYWFQNGWGGLSWAPCPGRATHERTRADDRKPRYTCRNCAKAYGA